MSQKDAGHPVTLVVLSPEERKEFLPEDLSGKIEKLLPDTRWVDAPDSAEEWHELLRMHQPEILICAWEVEPYTLPEEVASHLKYVNYLCGSCRNLVPQKLIADGLKVTNWGSSISNTIAECALFLTLSALRRGSNWALDMHTKGGWKSGQHPDVLSLFNRRVGLHGLGAISRELIPLLAPFNVEISAYSPSVPDEVFESLNVRRSDSLEDLFSTSDVLIELAPGKPSNYHLVGEALLNLLPENAVFVNVGRGLVVDEEVMIRVCREKNVHLALDVYETEPLPVDSPLRGLPNTTLYPHLGGPTPDRRRDCGAVALRNLEKYLNNDSLDNLVTVDVYERST